MRLKHKSVYPMYGRYPNNGNVKDFNPSPGLTVREHFAGLAMQALLSDTDNIRLGGWKAMAKEAVECSDALMAELEKPNG